MDRDQQYLELILGAVRQSASYKPMFGQGRHGGLTLAEFQQLYSSDPFYSWFGLDSPLLYTAQRISGGMTLLYRQIGIGCQWVLDRILQDDLGLTEAQASWSYTLPQPGGKSQTLTLDGRIPVADVSGPRKNDVEAWLAQAAAHLSLDPIAIHNGAVFEIRQGYKSKDSKRQNADVANAANAYAYQYLPVLTLLSNQIDQSVAARYERARWLILRGATQGSALASTYVFFRDIVGYDLAAFFERNSTTLRNEITTIMEQLLGSQ